jgi:orotate phosphoribosyltransferase
VLVVDDTWTTGANAQSAAGALKTTGAGRVAVLAIGRHVNPEWKGNRARLRALPPFSWETCAVH